MLDPKPLALFLALAVLAAGCGGDDEEERAATTDTTPTQAATPPPTTETTETTTAPDADEDAPTITRADARSAGRRPTGQEAEKVPGSDLYFLDVSDVTCDAPDADQPDNLNERSTAWSCEVDSEVNGVRCQGTYAVEAVGEPGDRFSGEPEVTSADISCAPA